MENPVNKGSNSACRKMSFDDKHPNTPASPEPWESSQSMPFYFEVCQSQAPETPQGNKRKIGSLYIPKDQEEKKAKISLQEIYQKYKKLHKEWQQSYLKLLPVKLEDFTYDDVADFLFYSPDVNEKSFKKNDLLFRRNRLAKPVRIYCKAMCLHVCCYNCTRYIDFKEKYITCEKCGVDYCMKCFKKTIPRFNVKTDAVSIKCVCCAETFLEKYYDLKFEA